MTIIGKCSICGGQVTVPESWLGIFPPTPTCRSCGAEAENRGPVIPMRPKGAKRKHTRGCPDCGCVGHHFCTGGQERHPGWLKRGEAQWTGYASTRPWKGPA